MNLQSFIKSGCLIGLVAMTVGCSSARPQREPFRIFTFAKMNLSGLSGADFAEIDTGRSTVTGENAHSTQNEMTDDAAGGVVQRVSMSSLDAPDLGTIGEPLDATNKTAEVSLAPDDEPSPAPASGQVSGLTLDQVINVCLIADPTIRAGLEAINQANADVLTSSLKPNPVLNVDGSLLPLTRPFTVDRQGGPPQFDVGLQYPIDWFLFGKRAAAMQSAVLGVRVSEATYADLVRARVLEAATAYYDLLEAEALRNLAAQDVENLARVEVITKKAVDDGGRPQIELSRIRLDRLRAEQALRDAENALIAATAALRALLGATAADPAFEIAGSLDETLTAEPLPVEEAYALALSQRPDLAALGWQVQQARAGTHVEYRKAYPEISPRIGYTHQVQEKAIGFPDANSWGIGMDVTLPLYDRNQGNRARAASVVAQTSHELRAGEVALRAEIETASAELRTAAANSRAVSKEQLKLAEQVRDSLNTAYEAGGRPLLDVLDAQRNYRETFRLYITSRASYGRAAVRYNATLGKQVIP